MGPPGGRRVSTSVAENILPTNKSRGFLLSQAWGSQCAMGANAGLWEGEERLWRSKGRMFPLQRARTLMFSGFRVYGPRCNDSTGVVKPATGKYIDAQMGLSSNKTLFAKTCQGPPSAPGDPARNVCIQNWGSRACKLTMTWELCGCTNPQPPRTPHPRPLTQDLHWSRISRWFVNNVSSRHTHSEPQLLAVNFQSLGHTPAVGGVWLQSLAVRGWGNRVQTFCCQWISRTGGNRMARDHLDR